MLVTTPQDFPSHSASDRLRDGHRVRTTTAWTQRQPQGFCLKRAECGKMPSLMLLSPTREPLQRKQN